jgi:hypothetical protein
MEIHTNLCDFLDEFFWDIFWEEFCSKFEMIATIAFFTYILWDNLQWTKYELIRTLPYLKPYGGSQLKLHTE